MSIEKKEIEREEVPVNIRNIDGIAQFALVLRHGMTELWGGNGERKTRVQESISDATSRRHDIGVGVSDARRDGSDALVGTVSVAERTLQVSRSGAVQRRGKMLTPLRIVNADPITRLIDPGVGNEEAKRKAQLRAFLELVPLEVSDDHLKVITSGDEYVLGLLKYNLEKFNMTDLLGATKSMRILCQREAREDEKHHDAAESEIRAVNAVNQEIFEELTQSCPILCEEGHADSSFLLRQELDTVELTRLHREAERYAGDQSARRDTYVVALARREKAAESAGDRPETDDLEKAAKVAKDGYDVLRDELFAGETQVEKLRREIERIRAASEAAKDRRSSAERELVERKKAQKLWDTNSKLVTEELTGPSHEDVAASFLAAKKAEEEVIRSRLNARYLAAVSKRSGFEEASAAAGARAKRLREIESAAWPKLGELVTAVSPVEEITISQGWLAYVNTDTGEIYDWNSKYVSDGQRSSAAMRLGARCARTLAAGDDPILMVAGRIWETHDLQTKLAMHRLCAEERVFGITEVASFKDHGLHSVAVGSEDWVKQFRELADAAAEVAG